jgi:membrane-bound serine protease (ClpP class)
MLGATIRLFRITGLLFIALGVLTMALPGGLQILDSNSASAQTGNATVRVVEIQGTIDLGLAPFLERAISEAESDGIDALILDINTPGGRLDATFQMRDALIGADVLTVAYINRDAFSAGALIALAAERVYMAPGATMGSATPVTGTGEAADEKNVSAVRSSFRSTAETRGRDPNVAQGMVDPSIEIEGLVTDEQLVALTSAEALEWGMSDGTVENLDALLEELGLEGASVEVVSQNWAERVVRILTEPIIASLLFSIGSLLIIFDIFSGDLSPLSGIGVGSLALFFWGHFLVGLAGWEGILLVLLGLTLIAVEIFIIPGFGIFGILGLAALMGGLFFSLTGDIVLESDLRRALFAVAGAIVVLLVGIVMMFIFLPAMGRFRGLVLQTRLGEDEPPPPERRGWFGRGDETAAEPMPPREERPSIVGQRGRALSDLRPGGFARINGQRVDVVSQGDYIRMGDLVEVVADDRYRRVVVLVEESDLEDDKDIGS